MPVNRSNNEAGFTMIMTVIGLSLMAALTLVAVTAVTGDTHLTTHDLEQKRAYEAAKSGIDNYAYHLHGNNSYWTSCANVTSPSEPKTAVNLSGSTANRLAVPARSTSRLLMPSQNRVMGPTFNQWLNTNSRLFSKVQARSSAACRRSFA